MPLDPAPCDRWFGFPAGVAAPTGDRARGMSRAPRCRPEPGGLYKALSPIRNPTLFTPAGRDEGADPP